jgi:hypothetical protein
MCNATNSRGSLPEKETREGDDALVDYLEKAPEPLPPRDPIGPPDVQPGEAPIKSDE